MCLIAFAVDLPGEAVLVLAANRDEHWDRPTQAISRRALPSGTQVYGGVDDRAGGMWMGVSERGRVAMLTNVRSPSVIDAPLSRGELVPSWLDSKLAWNEWIKQHPAEDYGPCNLVVGNLLTGDWHWGSNHPRAQPESTHGWSEGWWGKPLSAGIYGLSNAGLDTPWPKTLALKSALSSWLSSAKVFGASTNALRDALLCMRVQPDEALPSTGVSIESERHLSSTFVHAARRRYGTRSSSVLCLLSNGELEWSEWSHAVDSLRMESRPDAWPLALSKQTRLSGHWLKADT